MSIAAIQWAKQQPTGSSSRKHVLKELADHADANGEAWPCVSTLAESCEMDRKTVIAALAALQSAGVIADTGKRKGATGQVPIYILVGFASQRRDQNSTESGTVKQYRKRNSTENGTVPFLRDNSTVFPDKQYRFSAITVPKTVHGTVMEPSIEPSMEPSVGIDAQGVTKPTVPKPIRVKTNAEAVALQKSEKGSRIPDDWQPSREAVAVMREQFPQMDFRAATEEFRDYWTGVPSPGGLKSDWPATWRNNMRDKHAQGRCRLVAPASPELPIPRRSGHTTTEQARANVARTVNQLLTEGDGFE